MEWYNFDNPPSPYLDVAVHDGETIGVGFNDGAFWYQGSVQHPIIVQRWRYLTEEEKRDHKGPLRYQKRLEENKAHLEADTTEQMIANAIEMLKRLPSDKDRYDVIHEFCTHCGSLNSWCRCWDDE